MYLFPFLKLPGKPKNMGIQGRLVNPKNVPQMLIEEFGRTTGVFLIGFQILNSEEPQVCS